MKERFRGEPASLTSLADFIGDGRGSPEGSKETHRGEVVIFGEVMVKGDGVFWFEDDFRPEVVLEPSGFSDDM